MSVELVVRRQEGYNLIVKKIEFFFFFKKKYMHRCKIMLQNLTLVVSSSVNYHKKYQIREKIAWNRMLITFVVQRYN